MANTKSESITLVYDIIARVMDVCRDDYDLLARCALVDWDFNRAASRMLYSRVVLSPPFTPVLNLRDSGSIPESSNFSSACLPRNAPCVTSFEVSGYISPRPPPRNTLPEKISKALLLFINLVSVRFTPKTYHENLFQDSIPALLNLKALTELSVNAACTDDAHAPKLIEIGGLRKLTLYSPGRAILGLLPGWLEKLQKFLTELHLKNNCGSITPSILRSFVPHIKQTLQFFTLGLSYSLTNEDVFTFLGHINGLKHLELRYYWQLKYPPSQPRLSSLCSFTVTYPPQNTRKDVNEFDKWVRRAITGSPYLQRLRLRCEDDSIYLSHDALISHITRKHERAIKILDLSTVFVAIDQLRELFGTCTALEEFSIQAGMIALPVFAQLLPNLKHLHTASFKICNVPRTYQVGDAFVSNIMHKGAASLRRLTLNGNLWESFWTVKNGQGHAELAVRRGTSLVPPWTRASE